MKAVTRYALALRRRQYLVRPVSQATARGIIERYHYTGGAPKTGSYVHGLFNKASPQRCLGVVWWMPPLPGAAQKVARDYDLRSWHRVLMLSRSCLVPFFPGNLNLPNAASFLIAASIRLIWAEDRYDILLTYADEYQALVPSWLRIPGRIYAATNWIDEGWTTPRRVYRTPEGRQTSNKSAKHNYNRQQMEERGCELVGHFRMRRYTKLRPEVPVRRQRRTEQLYLPLVS